MADTRRGVLLATIPAEGADACDYIVSRFPFLSPEQVVSMCVRMMAHDLATENTTNHRRTVAAFAMAEDEKKRGLDLAVQARRIGG